MVTEATSNATSKPLTGRWVPLYLWHGIPFFGCQGVQHLWACPHLNADESRSGEPDQLPESRLAMRRNALFRQFRICY